MAQLSQFPWLLLLLAAVLLGGLGSGLAWTARAAGFPLASDDPVARMVDGHDVPPPPLEAILQEVLQANDIPPLPNLEGILHDVMDGGIPAIPASNEEQEGPLDRPLESPPPVPLAVDPHFLPAEGFLYQTPSDAPLGFTGPSGIAPREVQREPYFVPKDDRWRIGFPEWDRYGKGHPPVDDYPYKVGHWWDPYNQNVLKGDYAILGQNIFTVITATQRLLVEPRQTPLATTPFESTNHAFQEEFFGRPGQYIVSDFMLVSLDIFHGDAAFRPIDWRVKITPIFNQNYLDVDELAIVNPDVLAGTTRYRTFLALQEYFVEAKLADVSPDYDFVSLRAGSQPFVSDFRGFIFADVNQGVRLFGNRNSNREQYNLIFLRTLEKDTNSELNSFRDRGQNVAIANYFIQDFIWPGYTFSVSLHYNRDEPAFHFDKNKVLVRPDPAGIALPHGLEVYYLGFAGDGHINRFNISHAFYWAFGRDSDNPIANKAQDITAQMGAVELSYDRDWVRFRTSFFYASGDDDPNNGHACGFDAIFDSPNFAGGEFSYWQRQSIRLFGVNLVNRESLLPSLKSSKIQGQSNFVNPGLFLANAGFDIEITPKLRMVNNCNLLWFDTIEPLQTFVFQDQISRFIGTDLSTGFEYRPLLNNNVICTFGLSTLLPSTGFQDLFNQLRDNADPLFAAFMDVVLTY